MQIRRRPRLETPPRRPHPLSQAPARAPGCSGVAGPRGFRAPLEQGRLQSTSGLPPSFGGFKTLTPLCPLAHLAPHHQRLAPVSDSDRALSTRGLRLTDPRQDCRRDPCPLQDEFKFTYVREFEQPTLQKLYISY